MCRDQILGPEQVQNQNLGPEQVQDQNPGPDQVEGPKSFQSQNVFRLGPKMS